MKNTIKLLGIIAIMAVIGLSLSGCEEDSGDDSYTYKFINNSSFTIDITSSDLDPSEFSVNPGSTKSATSSKSSIKFTYTQANNVDATKGNGKITFTDK